LPYAGSRHSPHLKNRIIPCSSRVGWARFCAHAVSGYHIPAQLRVGTKFVPTLQCWKLADDVGIRLEGERRFNGFDFFDGRGDLFNQNAHRAKGPQSKKLKGSASHYGNLYKSKLRCDAALLKKF
jgi:hypothetical protein